MEVRFQSIGLLCMVILLAACAGFGASGPLYDTRWELESLNLDSNRLSGPIPPELGGLPNLTELELSDNELSGPIPPELGGLSNLTRLRLSGNQLSGCIPEGLREVLSSDLDQLGLPFCVPPTVTMSTASENYQVRINSPIPVTATFSGPVNGFAVDDVTVVNGTAGNLTGNDGDSVYTFDVIPNAIGVVSVDIAAGRTGDAEGYGNTAAAQLRMGLPYDDDGNGTIGPSEILDGVRDYFSGILSRPQILELVRLYFFGTS